jgi:thioredoxin-dependent adenylylsulfate APS reductase
MADPMSREPIHEPTLPVVDEETAWVREAAERFEHASARELLAWALERFHPRMAISAAGGVDGMAILDMAWRIDPNVRVFTVDTGRMHPETYELMDRVRERYGIELEVYYPDTIEVESFVRKQGVNPFYKSVPLRLRCCEIRKVNPLKKVLDGLDGWVTGLRRDQWASRSNIRKVEIDHDHGGLLKINPLADWMEEEVWEYIRANDVPYNALYDQGFTSIGCMPCTRPTAAGEDPRAGRWWWEVNAPKECGMHCPIETGGFEHEVEVLLDRHGSVAEAAG